MKKEFIFTSENLLDNLDKIGPWSNYGLCVVALKYYYKDYDEFEDIDKELELLNKLGCKDFRELIIKYHKEKGYTLNPKLINEY